EREHDEASTDPEPPCRDLEKSIESFELPVHPDAERLECPRRRVDPLITTAGDRATNYRREFQRGVDRHVRPSANDRPGNAPGETFFAVGVYRVGQLALPRASDQLGCRVARAGIHAHVERFVPLKAETSARRIELHRGDAQIGEGAVHLAYTPRIENVIKRPVVGVDQIDTIGPGCESAPSR